MTFPTRWTLPGSTPSRTRFSFPSTEGVNSRSASWSVTSRLTSSGILRSRERRPGLDMARRECCSFGAHQRGCDCGVDVAIDEDEVRPLLQNSSSNPIIVWPVWTAWEPADAEVDVRLGETELLEEHVGHVRS